MDRRSRVELLATLAVEVAVILFGTFFFIVPALSVQNRPVTTIPREVSVLAIVVPDASSPVNVQVTTSLNGPRSTDQVTVKIWIQLKQEAQPGQQPSIILAGLVGKGLDTCTNPAQAIIDRNKRWGNLNEQQRNEVTAQTQSQLVEPGSTYEESNAKQPDIARKVDEDSYVGVQLSLSKTQTSEMNADGQSKQIPALSVRTECTFSRDAFWRDNGPDSVLLNPSILVQYGGSQVGPGSFYYSTSFPKLQDYSVVSNNIAAASDRDSINWFRNQDDDCYNGNGQDFNAQRNCPAVTAIVRSASAVQSDSQVLFLGGAALGVVATISVDAFRVAVLLVVGYPWASIRNRFERQGPTASAGQSGSPAP